MNRVSKFGCKIYSKMWNIKYIFKTTDYPYQCKNTAQLWFEMHKHDHIFSLSQQIFNKANSVAKHTVIQKVG